MSPPVKAVLMDVGNVLVNFDLFQLLTGFKRYSDVSAFRIVRYVLASKIEDRFERGLMTADDLWAAAKNDLGFTGTREQFLYCYNSIFQENPDGSEIFRELVERLPVYLLSNTNEIHFAHVAKTYPFVNRAAGKILSHEVHARKPEEAIYRAALERAGVRAEEAFYVDDIKAYVKAAAKLGIRGAVFTDGPALRRDLAQAGIVL